MISVAMNTLVEEGLAMTSEWNPTKELRDGLRQDRKKAHDLAIKKGKAIKRVQLAELESESTLNLNQIKGVLS